MARPKHYIINPDTLSYELAKVPFRVRLLRLSGWLLAGLLCFLFYGWLYTRVLGFTLPKTKILERRNAELVSNFRLLENRLDEQSRVLLAIQMRDNSVYRPIFGMDQIPAEVRNAGFGGVDRYSYLKDYDNSDLLISSVMKMDILSKKAYVQSRSFDEVSLLARRAGDMAACVPSINPVDMSGYGVRLVSSYGYRFHPIYHRPILHRGIDITGPIGQPVFVTGDGVVESVSASRYGYGNCVLVDHGFGYKTRYAHLHSTLVEPGQKVSRGDQIARMGNSGLSTGPHLHYEVIYRGQPVNPWNYLANDLSDEEYSGLVRLAE